MSNTVIALFAAFGAGGWIYNRFMRTTGGNKQTAITTAVVSGIVIFVFMYLGLGLLTSWLE